MIDLFSILGFAVASFALAISPGPSWIYVIATTLRQGQSAGFVAVAGNGTGILCHTIAAACGLSAVLAYSAAAFTTVKWLGAIYLIYLGVRMMRKQQVSVGPHQQSQDKSHVAIFRGGLLVNVLNPKVALLMLALLPQIVDATIGSTALQTVAFGTLHALIASCVLSVITVGTSQGDHYFRPSRWIRYAARYVGGGILVAFGLRLALATRS